MPDDTILEMHALDAELEGMKAENEYRFRNDMDKGTFDYKAFCELADRYRALKNATPVHVVPLPGPWHKYAPYCKTIIAAAYYHDGKVYSLPAPNRHCHILWKFGDMPGQESGFIASTGEFVYRDVAYKIAKAAGQVIRDNEKDGYRGPDLYSEDLW